MPLGREGFDRIEAILRLLASLHGRVVPLDTRLTEQQRARTRRMLQAFDGRRAGATQQEIAEVVFRTGKLTRDEWQAASERHAVMSLLKGAREMIAGGYRKLGGRVVYAVDDLQAWANRGAVTSTSDPRGSVLPAKRHDSAPAAHVSRHGE
ncbi:DUF2285 domain-containing protein [Pelagibacterium halotolerans]